MSRALSVLLVCALTGGSAAAAGDPPGAFELLQLVREAYSALGAYRDEGEIRILAGAAEERYLFRTEAGGEAGFRLRFEPERGPDAGHRRVEPGLLASFGPGAREALVAPALLAEGSASLPDPVAAMIEGREPCGTSTCWLLAGAGPGDGVSWLLWIDAGSHLIRRVEVEVEGAERRRLVVEHRVLEAGRATAPPAGEPRAAETPEAGFSERIEVALTTLTVRVVDRAGAPVRELGPGDFRIVVGDGEVPVEAAEWVDPEAPWGVDVPVEELEAAGVEPPRPGRLIVFFVQTSLHHSRLVGQVRMAEEAKRFLGTLGPDDQVAVVSYDSHLKLRQDFTRDRDRLREALDRSITASSAPPPRPARALSLARHFEADAARRATTPERGLELTARALIPIEGQKSIVYLGWGLGEMTSLGVQSRPEYGDALRALDAAEVTVFVLDVSDSDYHTLEHGLRQVAADTGGTYAKTQDFARAATDRLVRTLGGHYLLYFRAPEVAPGTRLRVELREDLEGRILAPEFVLN